METYPLAAGTALTIEVGLLDGQGDSLVYSPPWPALSASVWPGGSRAASFAVAANWLNPLDGTVQLAILPGQTAALASGRYRGQLVVQDPTLGPVVAYEWSIDLVTASGSEPEPPSYCTYDDLLDYGGRTWLPDLMADSDEAGFAEQRGRARSWLEDLILNALPTLHGRAFGAGFGFGGWQNTTTYLRGLLDADRLIRRGWVVEATAKKALALVCEGQIGLGDSADQYTKLGRRLAQQARSLALARSAEIADQQGNLLFSLNLASGSFR